MDKVPDAFIFFKALLDCPCEIRMFRKINYLQL